MGPTYSTPTLRGPSRRFRSIDNSDRRIDPVRLSAFQRNRNASESSEIRLSTAREGIRTLPPGYTSRPSMASIGSDGLIDAISNAGGAATVCEKAADGTTVRANFDPETHFEHSASVPAISLLRSADDRRSACANSGPDRSQHFSAPPRETPVSRVGLTTACQNFSRCANFFDSSAFKSASQNQVALIG